MNNLLQIYSFRYWSCLFHIKRSKKKTARAVFNQKYGIPYSYTVEASFASFMTKDRE